MKKLLLTALVVLLCVAMVACAAPAPASSAAGEPASSGAEELVANTGKVAIITGTVSQGEEEFRSAENMKALYGDRVITATYPDNFSKETETTISNVLNLVSDPDVKALVFCQAVPGAAAAIQKARETKPDLLVICGVPAEDPALISSTADIVLSADEIDGMGNAIPQQALEMGAKTFVHYSFPRHMSYANLSARRDLFKINCEKLGIKFVEATAPDPTGDAGVPGAQQFIMEDVPKMIAKYGKDTAFFSTNCAMQEPLIKSIAAEGGLYPQPCCPSPFHGFPAALGIEIPEDKAGDTTYMIEQVTAKLKEKNMTGRMSTWPVPINMVEVQGATDYAMRWVDGEFTDRLNMAELEKSMSKYADGKKVSVSTLTEGGVNYKNYITLLCDFVTF